MFGCQTHARYLKEKLLNAIMYKVIDKGALKKYFNLEKEGKLYKVYVSNRTKPIHIKLPFTLNENVASLSGLMPDGSLIKDLMRIYFSQKKDLTKIELFDKLMRKLFSNKIYLLRKIDNTNTTDIYVNSKTLAMFFYHILDIPKSDEPTRVPKWIFDSPKSVKIAYLKQAFDMEGTILKRLFEIRFACRDKIFAEDIQRVLQTVEIKSHITFVPRPYMSSGQYRVSIYRKENFEKFKKVGFRIPFLKERFQDLLLKYSLS